MFPISYLENNFTEHAIRSYFASQGYGYDCNIETGMGIDWGLTQMGNDYLLVRGNTAALYLDNEILFYPCSTAMIFDLRTGEEISWQDMLVDGWQEAVPLINYDSEVPYDPDMLEVEDLFYIINDRNAPLYICFTNGTRLEVPIDWIKH